MILESKKLSTVFSLRISGAEVKLSILYEKNFFLQVVSADEDLGLIEKLWDRLDLALQTRESELEQAILKSERLRTRYESFIGDTGKIDADLELIKGQLDLCLRRFNDQNRGKKSVSDELRMLLERLEAQVHVKEQELRKDMIEALKLEEEKYPDANVLIEG
jgi:DNA repair exonuclease SbcCD ATPase subunit